MRKNFAFISIQSLCIPLAFISFVMLFACESYRTALEAEYFQQGEVAFKKKDYSQALEFFTKAQKVSFNNIARYRMAEIYLIQDEFDESRKIIDRLLWLDKQNILVHELNILWHIKKDEREKAAQLYEELEQKNIHMGGRVYANAAIFYLNGREYEKALEFFRKSDETSDEQSAEMAIAYLTALRLYLRPPELENVEGASVENANVEDTEEEVSGAAATSKDVVEDEVQTTQADETKVVPKTVQAATQAEDQSSGAAEIKVQNDVEDDVKLQHTENDKTAQAETILESESAGAADLPHEMTAEIALEFERVIGILTSLYEKNKASTENLIQAADDLVNGDHFAYAFPLYKAVAEKENAEVGGDAENETGVVVTVNASTRVRAYVALVNLIVKKQYEVSDEHAPLTVVAYIQKILKILFPQDDELISEYTSNLFGLLELEEMTEVLKKKLRGVYDEYKLAPSSQETNGQDADSGDEARDGNVAETNKKTANE